MRSQPSTLCLARAILEATTPLSISSGSPDGVFDTALVRDANGLPAIPGTSMAGVLRHLWTDSFDPESAKGMFGHQGKKVGMASRLVVSWGSLLDSQGRPAEGLFIGTQAARLNDSLLARAIDQIDAPLFRNRVRITHHGAAAHRGKFDRAVLPAGNRFAIELRLWAAAMDDTVDWNRLLDLFSHPGLRLGGATRAGLGKMRCVSLHQGRFDLCNPNQAASFRSLGRGLADTQGLSRHSPVATPDVWLTGTLTLKPHGLWRIGQGDKDISEQAEKPADLIPLTEERIEWPDGRGRVASRALLIPAASIKGVLAHRMAFHARRLASQWIEDGDQACENTVEVPKPAAVQALFGDVKDEDSGHAGCLFIDDAFVPIEQKRMARLMHNSIDRFTGGVRDRVLYEEESIFRGEFEIAVALDLKRLQTSSHAEAARKSLRSALDDLGSGRLAIGSRTTSGNGFVRGTMRGSIADWLKQAGQS